MTIAERDKIILENLPLVKKIVNSIKKTLPAHIEYNDLLSAGTMGLIQAIKDWDKDKTNNFLIYAQFRIIDAIYDECRNYEPLSRWSIYRLNKIRKAENLLYNKLNRAPTEEEILAQLNWTEKEYRRECLYKCINNQMDISNYKIYKVPNDPLIKAILSEEKNIIKNGIKKLSERKRCIVNLYFYEGKTCLEIGKEMGLTEGRISQLKKQALDIIKEFLEILYIK